MKWMLYNTTSYQLEPVAHGPLTGHHPIQPQLPSLPAPSPMDSGHDITMVQNLIGWFNLAVLCWGCGPSQLLVNINPILAEPRTLVHFLCQICAPAATPGNSRESARWIIIGLQIHSCFCIRVAFMGNFSLRDLYNVFAPVTEFS